MAPSKRDSASKYQEELQKIIKNVPMVGKAPESFISLKDLERECGLFPKDILKSGISLDDNILKTKVNGSLSLYISPDIITTIRANIQHDEIPETFLSETFLVKSLERKGQWPKGTIKKYRNSDPEGGKGWGVFGKKEGKGHRGYFYPRCFVRAKFQLKIFSKGCKTADELSNFSNWKPKEEAMPAMGLRLDGFFQGPLEYYEPNQLMKKP